LAEFREKRDNKIHVELDHSGMLPTFMAVSEGRYHDIHAARNVDLPRESTLLPIVDTTTMIALAR